MPIYSKVFFSIFSIKIYAILGHYVRSLKHKIITTLQMQFCISSEFMDKYEGHHQKAKLK